jgi:hypothetical protein
MPRALRITRFGYCAAVSPGTALASFLHPELMDTAAGWLVLFVLFVGATLLALSYQIFMSWVATHSDTPKAPKGRVSQAAA